LLPVATHGHDPSVKKNNTYDSKKKFAVFQKKDNIMIAKKQNSPREEKRDTPKTL
jgi:hypothetical protein